MSSPEIDRDAMAVALRMLRGDVPGPDRVYRMNGMKVWCDTEYPHLWPVHDGEDYVDMVIPSTFGSLRDLAEYLTELPEAGVFAELADETEHAAEQPHGGGFE